MRIVNQILLSSAAVGLCAACGTTNPLAAGTDWGPLAVIEGQPNLEDALAGGVLMIDDSCVSLTYPGSEESTPLAWPSEATRWNGDDSTISYETPAGEVVLSAGDEVSFGGGFKDSEADADWIVKPRSSCGTGGPFFVGGYSEGFSTGP